ncbi:hypothetical protein B0H14DRAFT_2201070, partial [Mycena olivaceomarginata]
WTACATVTIVAVYFRQSHGHQFCRSLPSGPQRLPIVGNLFDMPRSNVWETFSKWNNMYGESI